MVNPPLTNLTCVQEASGESTGFPVYTFSGGIRSGARLLLHSLTSGLVVLRLQIHQVALGDLRRRDLLHVLVLFERDRCRQSLS